MVFTVVLAISLALLLHASIEKVSALSCDIDALPVLYVAVVIHALKADRENSSVTSACYPRQAPTSGAVKYTYNEVVSALQCAPALLSVACVW